LNTQFSFIIITFNEEQHLPRLLKSIVDLGAAIFILDSGSTDNTQAIAQQYGAVTLQHTFENHPKQWDYALNNFDIQTPWIICLDADQIVTDGLRRQLTDFRDEDYQHVNGIYFNRKNYFKGRWIKHGGYSPFYLLKMIRYGVGYSDLNENMDHRFIVPGKTEVWKDGYILEENLKENEISFWINKHNRYSDLVAEEEVERMLKIRAQTLKPNFWGSPDERTAWLKQLWWKMPLYSRPLIYLIYRMFFRLGILDGRTGVIFHFLQAFWFRLIVDIKIDEILLTKKKELRPLPKEHSPLNFVICFIVLFLCFFYFNAVFFGITQSGARHYNAWIADNLNYISALRHVLLKSSAQILNWMGFSVITNDIDLLVAGRGVIRIAYDCLGLGVISFFAAFVISYPKNWKLKTIFLISGILGIELLNVIRFIVLALFWDKQHNQVLDHHTIFNIFIYLVIAFVLFFWIKRDDKLKKNNATN